MKVGDLVELSAQGCKLQWLEPLRKRIGLVVKHCGTRWRVHWFGKRESMDGSEMAYNHTVDRRSIRHVKAK
jgi:hypothetical protein